MNGTNGTMSSRVGLYVGPRPRLRGETALLRESVDTNVVYAQFDNKDLHDPSAPSVHLGFGWHIFSVKEFADMRGSAVAGAEGERA